MDIIMSIIELPLWAVVAVALAGVVVGMLLLMVAVMLLGRGKKGEEKTTEVEREEVVPVVDVVPEWLKEATVPPSSEPVAVATKPYRPVPPVRQHYWYYVTGVLGRFATLRDALSAAGEAPPADKMLDWKKLTADTRAKIKRVKVGDKQPVVEQVAIPEKVVQDASKVVEKPEKEPEQVVRKSIGGGAYVTIKKKVK